MEVLHIAGTNGKGSVAAYAANILGLNHKTGLYSSPHLVDPTERFCMNGEPIRKMALTRYVAKSKSERSGLPFEHWTHAAKEWLHTEDAEYAVVETGIGGRLDSTNIFDSKVQVLTTICYDHMDLLGHSLGQIAAEKAGIIKPNSTVVTSFQKAEVREVIEKHAQELQATVISYDPCGVSDWQSSLDGQVFTYRHGDLELEKVHIHAISPGQVENACVAALAARALGFGTEDIREGLERTRLRARAQYVPPDMLLDGAHNPAAMLELRRVVARNFGSRGVVALFGAMKDKDVAGMAKSVNGFANEVYCTEPDSPRAMKVQQFTRYFRNPVLIPDPFEAAEEAYRRAQRNGDLLVVCGSFYLIKPALEATGRMDLAGDTVGKVSEPSPVPVPEPSAMQA